MGEPETNFRAFLGTRKATTTMASARAECEARVGRRTRGGSPRPREPPGRARRGSRAENPDRRRGACGLAARGARISRTRRCRFNGALSRRAMTDNDSSVSESEARGATARPRRASSRMSSPSVSGTSSAPNATGRPSVVAPSPPRVLSRGRKNSPAIFEAAKHPAASVSVVLLFPSRRRVDLDALVRSSPAEPKKTKPIPDAGYRRGHVQRRDPRLGRRGRRSLGAARRAPRLGPRRDALSNKAEAGLRVETLWRPRRRRGGVPRGGDRVGPARAHRGGGDDRRDGGRSEARGGRGGSRGGAPAQTRHRAVRADASPRRSTPPPRAEEEHSRTRARRRQAARGDARVEDEIKADGEASPRRKGRDAS